MPVARQEIESPMLWDWEFEDELGITLDIGRFIVPSIDDETIGARMGEYLINDGRVVVGRTESYRDVDSKEIRFIGMPYNYMQELKNRVGAIFRIRDCFGDQLWAVLNEMRRVPMYGGAIARTEQLYDITLRFKKVSPT